MAAKKKRKKARKSGTKKRKSTKRKKKRKGQIPDWLLAKRAKRLNNLAKARGLSV